MKRSELIRVAIGVLIIVIGTWGGQFIGAMTAGSRIEPPGGPDTFPAAVQVELTFNPARFHRQILNSHGTYDGRNSTATSIRLFRVSEDSLHALSRYYWIDEIVVVEG